MSLNFYRSGSLPSRKIVHLIRKQFCSPSSVSFTLVRIDKINLFIGWRSLLEGRLYFLIKYEFITIVVAKSKLCVYKHNTINLSTVFSLFKCKFPSFFHEKVSFFIFYYENRTIHLFDGINSNLNLNGLHFTSTNSMRSIFLSIMQVKEREIDGSK